MHPRVGGEERSLGLHILYPLTLCPVSSRGHPRELETRVITGNVLVIAAWSFPAVVTIDTSQSDIKHESDGIAGPIETLKGTVSEFAWA